MQTNVCQLILSNAIANANANKKREINLYLLSSFRCDWIFACDEMRLSYGFRLISNLCMCRANLFKFAFGGNALIYILFFSFQT